MREEKWSAWETAGLFVVLIAGNLLHFVYGWSGGSPIAAMFAAVNESTWEHMKLLAMPWILWSVLEALALGKGGGQLLMPRALGMLTGLAAIPMLFYTYRGVTGQANHMVNIAIFQLAVLLAFRVTRRLARGRRFAGKNWQILGLCLLLVIGALFVRWTFHPPMLPLFADGRTGLTGIPK